MPIPPDGFRPMASPAPETRGLNPCVSEWGLVWGATPERGSSRRVVSPRNVGCEPEVVEGSHPESEPSRGVLPMWQESGIKEEGWTPGNGGCTPGKGGAEREDSQVVKSDDTACTSRGGGERGADGGTTRGLSRGRRATAVDVVAGLASVSGGSLILGCSSGGRWCASGGRIPTRMLRDANSAASGVPGPWSLLPVTTCASAHDLLLPLEA